MKNFGIYPAAIIIALWGILQWPTWFIVLMIFLYIIVWLYFYSGHERKLPPEELEELNRKRKECRHFFFNDKRRLPKAAVNEWLDNDFKGVSFDEWIEEWFAKHDTDKKEKDNGNDQRSLFD